MIINLIKELVFGKSEQEVPDSTYNIFVLCLTSIIEEATELLDNISQARSVYGSARHDMVKQARHTCGALLNSIDTLLGIVGGGHSIPAAAVDVVDASGLCKFVVDRATTLLASCACLGKDTIRTSETKCVMAELKCCHGLLIKFLSE